MTYYKVYHFRGNTKVKNYRRCSRLGESRITVHILQIFQGMVAAGKVMEVRGRGLYSWSCMWYSIWEMWGRAGKGACEEAREEESRWCKEWCLEMGLLILKNKKEMLLTWTIRSFRYLYFFLPTLLIFFPSGDKFHGFSLRNRLILCIGPDKVSGTDCPHTLTLV